MRVITKDDIKPNFGGLFFDPRLESSKPKTIGENYSIRDPAKDISDSFLSRTDIRQLNRDLRSMDGDVGIGGNKEIRFLEALHRPTAISHQQQAQEIFTEIQILFSCIFKYSKHV
jgi:hypothetical protein